MAKGTALRMAIRNGFDRAFVTIVDSNLTTLLTAIVLYAIGTDQVRGFGITLILGILTSMFTAIFATRTILEFGERARFIRKLSMTHFLTNPQIDWCSYLKPALILSSLLIAAGLVATVARGVGIFDIDLAGGSSVVVALKEPLAEDVVRKKLAQEFEKEVDEVTKGRVEFYVHGMEMTGEKPGTVYKVDSSLAEDTKLQRVVREAFLTPDGKDGLRTYQVSIGSLTEEPVEAPGTPPTIGAPPGQEPADTTQPADKTAEQKSAPAPEPTPKTDKASQPAEPPATQKPAAETPADENSVEKPAEEKSDSKSADKTSEDADEPSECQEKETSEETKAEAVPAETPAADGKPADAQKAAEPAEQPAAGESQPAEKQPAKEKPAKATPAGTTPAEPPAAETTPAQAPSVESPSGTTPAVPAAPKPQVQTTAELNFVNSPISADAVRERIRNSSVAVLNEEVEADLVTPEDKNWNGRDNSAFERWTVTLPLSKSQAQAVLDRVKSSLAEEVVWQTSSKIGGQVSSDTRWRAVGAIFVSLLGILGYLWFRFQKAVWGIAAIVALAHDALIMLGGIAVSYWLAGPLGFMQVEEFKISLPVVAAFLTLIGFSVNDTIVIFDRIREVRGKSPDVTAKMINDSVNQTLSRTILTSGTVLITVVILFFFGGPGIHAFAFAMICGVLSGTYSTVFIAAPLVLWLLGKPASDPAARQRSREARAAGDKGGGAVTRPSRTA
ncbi:MAG TPA: protein translocase subunit SecF, partial [Pirellulaceae bacterium]|nr:protein translocase subunit SecF [Pirellulaceae bacterium]